MVVFVEVECINCSLVVDANESCGIGDGGGEESSCRFLHGVQFSIIDFCPVAEMTASFFNSEELLIPNIIDYPTTSS